MQMLKRCWLIIAILVSCVGCDQSTKFVAKTYLPQGEPITLLGGSVQLGIAKNYGAFLSLGASIPKPWRTAIFTVGVAVALVGLLAYALRSSHTPLTIVALGMVIGGGASNLIDRWVNDGYVLDFLNVGIGVVRTGIFNVADMLILGGVILLVFHDRFAAALRDQR